MAVDEQIYHLIHEPCPKCGEKKLTFKLTDVTLVEQGQDYHVLCEGCGWDGTIRISSYDAFDVRYYMRNRDAFIERVEAWKGVGRL